MQNQEVYQVGEDIDFDQLNEQVLRKGTDETNAKPSNVRKFARNYMIISLRLFLNQESKKAKPRDLMEVIATQSA
jgi:hypothetical protein